jgi:hypothetical protein
MKYALIALTVISFSANALETDQFLATKIILKDSASVLDNYFNKQIDEAVQKINEKNPEKIKCEMVADAVMNNLVGGKYLSLSKVSKFAKFSPEVEKFPDLSISDRDYFKMTFYEEADVLLKMAPLARTINVNGIYMGTDKLGHFSLIGRNYYHNYLSFKKKGQTRDEAMKNAILKGFATERGVLGYDLGGVLSFGDLEANYEGMQFAIDMCEGEQPYLQFKNGRFEKIRDFNLKTYFNARMDESVTFSFWRPGLYKRVKPKLTKEYCETRNDPMFIERVSKYPANVENINDRLIINDLLKEARFNRTLEDVKTFCEQSE